MATPEAKDARVLLTYGVALVWHVRRLQRKHAAFSGNRTALLLWTAPALFAKSCTCIRQATPANSTLSWRSGR